MFRKGKRNVTSGPISSYFYFIFLFLALCHRIVPVYLTKPSYFLIIENLLLIITVDFTTFLSIEDIIFSSGCARIDL